MCLRKEYFDIFKLEESGIVHLDDNKVCKVHGIDTIKLKMLDDHDFLFHNIKCVSYRKLILLSISMLYDMIIFIYFIIGKINILIHNETRVLGKSIVGRRSRSYDTLYK